VSLEHALPSSGHATPAPLFTIVQPPLPSHVDVAWQLVGVHVYAVPPQAPFVQTSFFEQALPSLHAVPLALLGFEHTPVAGLHVPAAWH
jgi:hypothetical protein